MSSGRLKITKDNVAAVLKGINSLVANQVLVGIPSTEAERDDEESGPINNAPLGYIHDNGSPANNIPARPFLREGINDAKDRILKELNKGAQAALDGKSKQADQALKAAGMAAQNAVRARINSGAFEPLSDATLKARARRGRKGAMLELESRAAGNAPGNANAKPLIDTGQLRNSITYVIRKKK